MSQTFEDEDLEALSRDAFAYFLHETNPANGLVYDKASSTGLRGEDYIPASIAAVGFALAVYPVGVERGWVSRDDARDRTLAALRFFWSAPQGKEVDATGYKGFFYHFLDISSGKRTWNSELSTVDTGFLLAGMLSAASYFDQDSAEDFELRTLVEKIYERVDWQWATNRKATLTHGWKPEQGFLKYRWEGYDEALLLYLLSLGSPSFPLPEECYRAWCSTYRWCEHFGQEFLFGGPLFLHQYSHAWIDFRGIKDAFMTEVGIDYFENSRRASYVQQEYALLNPSEFAGYGKNFGGITASDGPGRFTKKINGVSRRFFSYKARAVPHGPDDGTIAPWAAGTSLPFAPEIVLPALQHFREFHPHVSGKYSLISSINLTFEDECPRYPGWASAHHFGVNLGPLILMIENYRSGLPWSLMRKSPAILTGLRRAGFSGGWL